MSSRSTYVGRVFVTLILTAVCTVSVHAGNATFKLWTPQSNRPVYTTDLMAARQALKTFQDTLQGYRNGSPGTYLNSYLPRFMDNAHLMRNAQLFMEQSHWQQARQKIEQLDSLLILRDTPSLPAAVDAACNLLEEGKRDIDERLQAIALFSKTGGTGRTALVVINSPDQLSALHSKWLQHKARTAAKKPARNGALPQVARNSAGKRNSAGNRNQGQSSSTITKADAADRQQEAQLRGRLQQAGLSEEQINQAMQILQQESSPESQDQLIAFFESLTPEQQQALLAVMGAEIKQFLTKAQQSSGFVAMIKRNPAVIGTLAVLAGAAITWALLRAEDPGTAFGQKIRSVFSWLKSLVMGTAANDTNNNNNTNSLQPNNGAPLPAPNTDTPTNSIPLIGATVPRRSAQVNVLPKGDAVIILPDGVQPTVTTGQSVANNVNSNVQQAQPNQGQNQLPSAVPVGQVGDQNQNVSKQEVPVQQAPQVPAEAASNNNTGLRARLGGWLADKWQRLTTAAQNVILPDSILDEAFNLGPVKNEQ